MLKESEILVLGAGVIGLTTSILLLKKGYNVTIWAKDLPQDTTSSKAAAFWYPYLCKPRDKAIKWAEATLGYLQDELVTDLSSGCITRHITELFDRKVSGPWWEQAVNSYRRLSFEELPTGYKDGYHIEAVLMDTSIYLEYLLNDFKKRGGIIIQKEIKNISEAFEKFRTVVNCTGLGSYFLFGDKLLYPVRGQTVRVKPINCDKVIVDDDGENVDLAYIIPRLKDIVLGGTAQVNNWDTNVSEKDTEDILNKCSMICPDVKNAVITEVKVGLRPARNAVRLEVETFGENKVVHNYGHGGAGFTLSWGCAKDVVDILGGS